MLNRTFSCLALILIFKVIYDQSNLSLVATPSNVAKNDRHYKINCSVLQSKKLPL